MSKKNGVVEAEGVLRFDLNKLSVQDATDFQTRFAYAKRAEIMARVIEIVPDTWDAEPEKMLARFTVFKDAEATLIQQMRDATVRPEPFVWMSGLSFVDYDVMNIGDVDLFFQPNVRQTAAALSAVVLTLPERLGNPASHATYMNMPWADFNYIQMCFIDYIGAYRKN